MHFIRPIIVFLGLAGFILFMRITIVPSDFGIHEKGYLYGWYRKSNEKEWADLPIKFQGKGYCQNCHGEPYKDLLSSPHRAIECENCHGPAAAHPAEPAKLAKNTSRDLCLRCHSYLPYPTSIRSQIKGIDPARHNPGGECVSCHDAHKATKPG